MKGTNVDIIYTGDKIKQIMHVSSNVLTITFRNNLTLSEVEEVITVVKQLEEKL